MSYTGVECVSDSHRWVWSTDRHSQDRFEGLVSQVLTFPSQFQPRSHSNSGPRNRTWNPRVMSPIEAQPLHPLCLVIVA